MTRKKKATGGKKKKCEEVLWMGWDEDQQRFEPMTGSSTRRDCHEIMINGASANRNRRVDRVRVTELPLRKRSK